MSKRIQLLNAIVTVMFVCAIGRAAQVPQNDCRGPIYEAREVSVPAKITKLPEPAAAATYPDAAGRVHFYPNLMGPGVPAHVFVEVILCRTGVVTDIKVIKSEPPNAAQFVSAALTAINFKPAEANWHTVSQRQTFEVTFNERGLSGVRLAKAPEGLIVKAPSRLTEEIYVIGNRRLSKDEILTWTKTHVGDPFDPDQVNQDLQALLKTGWFNAVSTRVTIEDTARGNVRVIFEVAELPLISQMSFEGVAGMKNQSAILNEFARQHLDIAIGRPLDVVNLKKAVKAIEDYFAKQGWANVKADATVANVSATEVKITFQITGTNF